MRLSCQRIITLCLILFPYIVVAQGSYEEDKTDTIGHIFKEIPIEGKLNEVSDELYEQLKQNPFGLPPSGSEQMVTKFSKAFATDALLSDAWVVFRQNANASNADSALKQISNGDVRHALKTEKEYYSLQGIRKRIVNRYEMEQDPPSQNRVNLINALIQATSASESEVESQTIIFRAVVTGFGELSDQQSFSESQIDGFVDNYRNQVQSQVGQELAKQLLLMYHGLSNDVLKNYVAFYESESGKWLSKTTSESINSAYRAAADRFLESIRNQE